MFKTYKKLHEIRKEAKEKDKKLFKKNKEGDFLYEINLSKSDAYSKFSTEDNPILEESFTDHIDDVCNCLTFKNHVEFRVHTPKSDPVNRDTLEKIMDDHYLKKYNSSKKDYKQQLGYGILLFVIGLVLFAAYLPLRIYLDPESIVSFLEILDIASWVFLWEAVDVIGLGIIHHKADQMRYAKIVNAKINVIIEDDKKAKTKGGLNGK